MYFTTEPRSGGYRALADGANYELVWWTEVYTTRAAAQNAIRMLQLGAARAPVYNRLALHRQASMSLPVGSRSGDRSIEGRATCADQWGRDPILFRGPRRMDHAILPDKLLGANEGLLKMGLICFDLVIWLLVVPAACASFS